MKKLTFLFISLITAMVAVAQTNPNRIIVHETSGYKSGYLAERVDSVTFYSIEGEVSASVTLHSYAPGEISDTLKISVTRTPICYSYVLDIVPSVTADRLDEVGMAAYLDSDNRQYDNYDNAQLTGVKLEPDTKYDIVTVGYDEWGIACGVKRTPFTTPKKPVIGNPFVEMTVTDVQRQEFTVHFEPNADVKEYYVLAMKEGELQAQFEMFAPMFGFKNYGEMVKMWGAPFTEAGDFRWTDMEPNTKYEVFVQALDVEGTFAELGVITLNTLALGGEGEAKVDIALGKYELTDWYGEMLPSQFIQFTPNDQTSSYRFTVFYATEYDTDPDGCVKTVCQEPPMPNMANWFFFEPIETDFQLNPGVEAVAVAAGKNINGEWGEPTILRFTTSTEADVPTAESTSSKIKKRPVKVTINQSKPVFVPAAKIDKSISITK